MGSGSSILPPLSRPRHADDSIIAFTQSEPRSPPTRVASPSTYYHRRDSQRLESLLKEIIEFPVNDGDVDDKDGQPTISHHSDAVEPLLPDFAFPTSLPSHTLPTHPPSPAKSTKPTSLEEPVVRDVDHSWVAMGNDLDALKRENRDLKARISQIEKPTNVPTSEDHTANLEYEIGRLRYQNEHSKTQKAIMVRTLSEKDISIKRLQMDLNTARELLKAAVSATSQYDEVVKHRDYLRTELRDKALAGSRLPSDSTEVKDQKIHELLKQVGELEKSLEQATNSQSNDYKTLAQSHLDQLTQCETLLQDTEKKYAAEHTKAIRLDDLVKDLRHRLSQVEDLQSQLSEKTTACDRLRGSLKIHEKKLLDSQQRLDRASDTAHALRGASHLVKPRPDTKFSPLVLGCSECYAKNLTCDNKACCRNCFENNEKCARWRCSIKHILDRCPVVPCTFPHDTDGWLLAPSARPQW